MRATRFPARRETPGVEVDVATALQETQGPVHTPGQGVVVVGAHELGEGPVEDLVGLILGVAADEVHGQVVRRPER